MTAINRRHPLQIAVVTETYPPEINGVAHTMRHLVQGLRARGHQVLVVRPRQAHETHSSTFEMLVPGVPIPGYRSLRFGLPVASRLRKKWAKWRPDVLYIATQGPLGHAALYAACGLGIPAATGFHTQFHHYSRYYGCGWLNQLIMHGLKRFHNRSAATLVPTMALQRQLEQQGFAHLELFTRGVDTTLFSPVHRSARLRQHWGCDQHSLVVLYVGRLAAEKNIDLVFQSFAAIAAHQPSSRLVVVGDGPERARLERLYPDAIFAGAKIGAALAAHYASADVFLFPSCTETFGNVVPEAMASGLPVVAFDDAAARELIVNRCNGFKVPLSDTTGYSTLAGAVALDRAQLTAAGQAARATAETLSWDRVIALLEQRLLALIHRYPHAGNAHESLAALIK